MASKQKNLLRTIYTVFFPALCVALLIVAAFRDYQLDAALNAPENAFGQFLAHYGELPVYLVIPFAFAVLFRAAEGKGKKILFGALYFLAGILFGIQFTERWYSGDLKSVFAVLTGLVIALLGLLLVLRISPETIKRLKPFALFILMSAACTAIATESMKQIWGRVRYRDLAGTADFTAWYLPQGRTGNKSFPSGHTSAAASIFALIALPDVFSKLKKLEFPFFLLAAAFTFAVGVSRMIVGAHYLSDIAMGAMLGFCFYSLFRKVYLEKRV